MPVKPKIKKTVKVYLNPKSKKGFFYKGSMMNAHSREYDPRNVLEAFWLEEEIYLAARGRYEAEVADGNEQAFPQFVLVDEKRRNQKENKLWDQATDKVGGLGGVGRPAAIIEAFESLDRDDDNAWNKDGTVSIRELESRVGFQITKSEVLDLVGDINRPAEETEEEIE